MGLVSVGDISSINITRRSDGMEWRNASSLAWNERPLAGFVVVIEAFDCYEP